MISKNGFPSFIKTPECGKIQSRILQNNGLNWNSPSEFRPSEETENFREITCWAPPHSNGLGPTPVRIIEIRRVPK